MLPMCRSVLSLALTSPRASWVSRFKTLMAAQDHGVSAVLRGKRVVWFHRHDFGFLNNLKEVGSETTD